MLQLFCFGFGVVRDLEAIVPVLKPWLCALIRLVMHSRFCALAV
jgi:hypothetical protein